VKRIAALALAWIAFAAGCSDDDGQGGGTTTAPPATVLTTVAATTTSGTIDTTDTTAAPSTSPGTTDTPTAGEVTTTSTNTTPPVDEEALKAEIARDYERAFYRRWQMLRRPSLHDLHDKAASVLAEGSPAFDALVHRIQELVALGDALVPNEPDLLDVTVESVRLVGQAPYTRAIVTACEVTNRKQVTLPENSPTGHEIEVAGSGRLLVTRFQESVRRTGSGWLRYTDPREGTRFENGETTCSDG
jgi:hypothetical protein